MINKHIHQNHSLGVKKDQFSKTVVDHDFLTQKPTKPPVRGRTSKLPKDYDIGTVYLKVNIMKTSQWSIYLFPFEMGHFVALLINEFSVRDGLLQTIFFSANL